VQTFYPAMSFHDCARMLDNKRLGKQRVECLQILKALRGETKGWRNHPATLMWYGHGAALAVYMNCCISEWCRRGFKNKMEQLPQPASMPEEYWPAWILDWEVRQKVIDSHRSNLLRKDPVFYGQYGWNVPPDLPYFWPVKKEDVEVKRVLELCP
jgi:hypothetical protein